MQKSHGQKKSTTVRAGNHIPTSLRVTFRLLDRIAPSVAGRWALRIWCTLPTSAGRRHDNRPFPGHRSDVDLPDGRRVAVETWEPHASDDPAGTVHLIHGWGGWRGQLGAFVAPFVRAGWRVVAFDAPSHGESSPSMMGRGRATALDLVDATTAVYAQFGEPDGIVAHSLGCTTAGIVVGDGLRTGRLAFIAPGVDPIGQGTGQLRGALGFSDRTHTRMLARLADLADRPLDDFNLLARAYDDQVPPALIVHDRQDKETPYDDGERLAGRWPEAELVSTDGLGHQRILLDEGVIKLVVDYITG